MKKLLNLFLILLILLPAAFAFCHCCPSAYAQENTLALHSTPCHGCCPDNFEAPKTQAQAERLFSLISAAPVLTDLLSSEFSFVIFSSSIETAPSDSPPSGPALLSTVLRI